MLEKIRRIFIEISRNKELLRYYECELKSRTNIKFFFFKCEERETFGRKKSNSYQDDIEFHSETSRRKKVHSSVRRTFTERV